MDIFGIGPLEVIFIVIIMLIVLGPTDMAKAGKAAGRTIRQITTSPTWRMLLNTSRVLRNLPNTLAREAGMEEIQRDLLKGTERIRDINKELKRSAWVQGTRSNEGQNYSKEETSPLDGDLTAWTTPPPPLTNTIAPPPPPGEEPEGEQPPSQKPE